jgi:hypothetical protein
LTAAAADIAAAAANLQGKSRCVAPSFGLAGQAHAWLPDLTQLVEWIAAPLLEQQMWEQEEEEQQQQQVMPAPPQADYNSVGLAASSAATTMPAVQALTPAAPAAVAAAGSGQVLQPSIAPAKLELQQFGKIDDSLTAAAAEALAAVVAAYVEANSGGGAAEATAQETEVATQAVAASAGPADSAAVRTAAPANAAANDSSAVTVTRQPAAYSPSASPKSTAVASMQQQQQQEAEEEDLDVSFNACFPVPISAAPAGGSDSSGSSSRAPAMLLRLPGAAASRDSSMCGHVGMQCDAADSLDGASGPVAACYAAQQLQVKFSRFDNSLFSENGQQH